VPPGRGGCGLLSGREAVGVVLSGATARRFDFVVLEGSEGAVSEGMYVAASSDDGLVVAVVEGLRYYHEFYEEGDVWIASVRRGRRIPEGLAARRYLRGRARAVALVPQPGAPPEAVRRPPRPGAHVYLVGPEVLEGILGARPDLEGGAPPHLLPLGFLLGYEGRGYRAYLDLRALTMHLAVLGTTGSGKSNTVGVVLEELAAKREADVGIARLGGPVPVLVADVNGDYVDFYRYHDIAGGYARVYRLVLGGSMAERGGAPGHYRAEQRRLVLDLNELDGHELADAIVTLYRRGPSESSALQQTYLERLLSDWERLCGEGLPCDPRRPGRPDFNRVFQSERSLEALLRVVEADVEAGRVDGRTAAAVRRQLANFAGQLSRFGLVDPGYPHMFGGEFVDDLTEPGRPKMALLDLGLEGATGAGLSLKQFIVYYTARLLFDKFVRYKVEGSGEGRVLLFVLEEAQNFAPNLSQYPIGYSVARNVLSLVATQGRKFGLALALVTQRPRYVDPTILNMVNTFIIHRVAPADVSFVENVTGGVGGGLGRGLTTMERGVAIVVGQMNPSPHPLLVRVRKRAHHDVAGA